MFFKVSTLEQDQQRLVQQRKQELVEKYHRMDPNMQIDDEDSQELVLREISSTLAQRKKLHNQVSRLEIELNSLEKIEERKQAQMSLKTQPQSIKSTRKSRDYRIRTQDWPDVPDIGKIEEQNPEILAQKILETGRKIEASKMIVNTKVGNDDMKERNNMHKNYSHQNRPQKGSNNSTMPAPMPISKQRCPKQQLVPNNYNPNRHTSEPPRVVNFEDRLKSIITSVLNEDEQYRSKQSNKYPVFNNNEQPKVQNNNNKQPYPTEMYQNPHLIDEKQKELILDYKQTDMYTEHIVQRQEMDSKHHRLTNSVEYRKEMYDQTLVPSNKKLSVEQPDYTQVSPAKLALRRHLSQEKLAAQQSIQYQHPDAGLVATRTIGDLMSGEIERTLEISNQSIINAAVDMSDIHGTTTVTPRSVVNQNLPPRPERVNIKLMPVDNKEPERQLYSPISRPSSTEGNLEGLAYLHHTKTPNVITSMPNVNTHLNTTSVLTTQNTSRTNVLYPPTVNGSMYKMINRNMPYPKSTEEYTPLPRADIKPYHESYFTDSKPPVSIKIVDIEPKNQFVPEGLAATLHARVLNTSVIKEEALDLDTRRECIYPENYPESTKIIPPNYNSAMVNIKSESECKSPMAYYPGQKRISPVIQGPIRRKPDSEELVNGRQGNGSPEPHSNTSTPLVDEVPEREIPQRQEEGKIFFYQERVFLVVFFF